MTNLNIVHEQSDGDITWAHTHSLCTKSCECWPDCKKENRKKYIDYNGDVS